MFELASEDRQRKSTVLQIIRKSVPSGRASVAELTSSILVHALSTNDTFSVSRPMNTRQKTVDQLSWSSEANKH